MANYYRRSEVGLAEFIQVLNVLRPERVEDFIAIADSIGLLWDQAVQEQQTRPSPSINSSIDGGSKNVSSKSSRTEASSISEIVQTSDSENLSETLLKPISYKEPTFETIFDEPTFETIDKEIGPTNITSHLNSPEYKPLLKTQWFRGIMSVILSTSTDSRVLDWRKLERQLINLRPLEKLPLKQRPTLKYGVVLYLDRSDSMQPFWRDEEELLIQLKQLLGPHKVQVFWAEVDWWSSHKARLKWDLLPPKQFPTRTPILVISDFGSKGKKSDRNSDFMTFEPWLSTFNQAKSNKCPIIALIPSPEEFWSKKLRQLIPFSFSWDKDTSTQTVARQSPR